MYAPIIIFAFNRPNALKNTVLSLLENKEAKAAMDKLKGKDNKDIERD